MNPARDHSDDSNSWNEHRIAVLASIESLREEIDAVEHRLLGRINGLDEKLDRARLEIVELKTRATVWGGIAGAIVGTLFAVVASALLKHGGQ